MSQFKLKDCYIKGGQIVCEYEVKLSDHMEYIELIGDWSSFCNHDYEHVELFTSSFDECKNCKHRRDICE